MLIEIKNVLSPSQVAEAESMLEAAQWIDGKTTAGHLAQKTKHNLQLDQTCNEAKLLGDFIVTRLRENPTFTSAALPNKIFPPMFNCYQGGGEFGLHIDNAIRYPAESPHLPIRTDLSITVFCSDPNSYEGGELIIEDTFGTQSVKLEAGSALLYPATSLHKVKPVTSGRRLASFFWIQSLIRLDEQRRILYELDKSIQALTAQNNDEPELINLTGVYHNLLRQWSEI